MASIITRSELMGKNPHNAAVPIADHSSVFDGVDFDIYTLDGLGSSLALEDAVDVSGGVPVLVKQIGPIRNQAAAIDHTIRPLFGARANSVTARSISPASCALTAVNSTPSDSATELNRRKLGNPCG